MTSRSRSTAVLFVLIVLMSGCGGGNNNNDGPPMPFTSGLHSMTATNPADGTTIFVLAGSLMQNGSSLSGTVHFQGSSCFAFATDIPITGTLTASEADVTAMLPNGQRVTFTGMTHPGGHPPQLAGNFSVAGSGCLANTQGLVFDREMNLSTRYVGQFISSTGTTASVTLILTQTGPDAHGLFSATGTATFTGGTCFSSATFDPGTVLVGKGSTLVLDDTASGSTGKTTSNGDFVASNPNTDGLNFFDGTYTSMKGTCSETGTVHLAP
jgi:hypothetical protein